MTLHPRTLSMIAGSDGSASGTISVPASRLAGVYFTFDPQSAAGTITASNLGRTVFLDTNAHSGDPVYDNLPSVETLVSGDIAVGAASFADGDRIDLQVWLDQGR